jgi:hypothetical protein
MKTTTRVWAVLLALVSCAPPRADHPLSDPKTAKVDAKLVGSWRGTKEGDVVFFHVMEKEAGLIDAVLVGTDSKKGAIVITLEGFTTELGGKKYLNLRPKTAKTEYGEGWNVSDRYLFVLYSVANGALSLSMMDDDIVKAAVTAGKLEGEVKDGDVVLTSDTPKLAEFVKGADSAKLFKLFATFKPVR